MHKKPTRPFRYITISPTRRFVTIADKLPDEKSLQEREVLQRFVDYYNLSDTNGVTLILRSLLPENDHDGVIDYRSQTVNQTIHCELTELVSREFLRKLQDSKKSDLPDVHSAMYMDGDELFLLDEDRRNDALRNVIHQKLQNHYERPLEYQLWLIIFSTSYYPLSEFSDEQYEVDRFNPSKGLVHAQEHLADNQQSSPFDAIWFFDLVHAPLQIWPIAR
jgi:hypothetical protein